MQRTITFTVDATGGISPAAPQYAGVQGEDKATAVLFDLSAWSGENYFYRAEYVSGAGQGDTTDVLVPDSENKVSVPLLKSWTTDGGRAVVRLVASVAVQDGEYQTVMSVDAPIYYRSKEEMTGLPEGTDETGLTHLILSAHEAADEANAAAEGANAAAERADTAIEAANEAAGKALAAEVLANSAGAAASASASAADTSSAAADAAALAANKTVDEIEKMLADGVFDGAASAVKATNVVLTTTSGGNRFYEITLDLPADHDAPFVTAVTLPVELGYDDWMEFRKAVGGTVYTSPKGAVASGTHLFGFDGEKMIDLKGDRGEKGEKGDKGETGGATKTVLYDNADGYSSTYSTFMTADPTPYDYFVVETSRGTFTAYMGKNGYISGGSIITVGGGDYYTVSVCFGVDASNQWTCYELLNAKTSSSTTTNESLSIYKITGVQYNVGLNEEEITAEEIAAMFEEG